jgi:hypothetical protein
MRPDVLVPLAATVLGCYLVLRSGYLRAVLFGPIRRTATVDGQLVMPMDVPPVTPEPEPEPERERHHAGVH